jgi:hypothetical protein
LPSPAAARARGSQSDPSNESALHIQALAFGAPVWGIVVTADGGVAYEPLLAVE